MVLRSSEYACGIQMVGSRRVNTNSMGVRGRSAHGENMHLHDKEDGIDCMEASGIWTPYANYSQTYTRCEWRS